MCQGTKFSTPSLSKNDFNKGDAPKAFSHDSPFDIAGRVVELQKTLIDNKVAWNQKESVKAVI